MKNTIQINMIARGEELQYLLIAELTSIGFDAFEEKDNELDAFIKEENFEENDLQDLLSHYKIDYKKTLIKHQNWNALWESNFPPVAVEDFCFIKAHFHPSIPGMKHEIVITPKMSFGTGHHATTYMMVAQMKNLDFSNKSVADFGTGTGILAILAEKLGAKSVWAIDNDDWSIENALENIEKNNCSNIILEKAEKFGNGQLFDVILANINKNVILDNAHLLAEAMKTGSQLLLSGLMPDDEAEILKVMEQYNIFKIKTLLKNNWISILLKY